MRMPGSDELSTRKGYNAKIFETITTLTENATTARLEKWIGQSLKNLAVVPALFSMEKQDFRASTAPKVKKNENAPLCFDIDGGESLQLARVESPGYMEGEKNYKMAFKICGASASGVMLEHPWVMVSQGAINGPEVVVVDDKLGLKNGEDKEILRYLALLSPKSIDTSEIRFDEENALKLVVLDALGVSIADTANTPELDITEFEHLLGELDILGANRTNATIQERYIAKLAEVNRLRHPFLNADDEEGLTQLFNTEANKQLLGPMAADWVIDICQTLATSDKKLDFESLGKYLFSPTTGSPLSVSETEMVRQFALNNGLAMPYPGSDKYYLRTPYLEAKMG